MDKSFDVFLSHNSKDKPAVRELAEALRARGLKVWLDDWELVPGRPWLEALERVIETVGCAAVLVGRDGLGPWEAPEMRACLIEFVGRGLPVIPVLLPGAPDRPSLPLLLRQLTWVDLRPGLTAEGVDHLLWGITGEKPLRNDQKETPQSLALAGPLVSRETGNRSTAAPLSASELIRLMRLLEGDIALEESNLRDDPRIIERTRKAIDQLPASFRRFLLLDFVERLPQEEIQRQLGLADHEEYLFLKKLSLAALRRAIKRLALSPEETI